MDILLNLKVEQAIQSHQLDVINSSRGGHGAVNDTVLSSQRSDAASSSMTAREGPPKVYEELI